LCGGEEPAATEGGTRIAALALLDRAIVRVLPAVPRRVVRRLSDRYIAGPELADAVATVRALNAQGKKATLDVLGEEVLSADEALAIRAEYERAMAAIEAEGLDANVSVKPTALGLHVDPELCAESVRALARIAAGHGRFVRMDMEDSSTTTATLDLYRRLREEGHENVGIVLQAMLRRTLDDVGELAGLQPNVRVCKGIYVEPADIAYQGDEAIRFAFGETMAALWEGGAKVAVATHDDALVARALELIRERSLGPERYEFQLLLGVREELADELAADGHTVRIYVPYGQKWYEYSLRRLQENPKLAGYAARDLLQRLRP
jgi:proline dehydrogenase